MAAKSEKIGGITGAIIYLILLFLALIFIRVRWAEGVKFPPEPAGGGGGGIEIGFGNVDEAGGAALVAEQPITEFVEDNILTTEGESDVTVTENPIKPPTQNPPKITPPVKQTPPVNEFDNLYDQAIKNANDGKGKTSGKGDAGRADGTGNGDGIGGSGGGTGGGHGTGDGPGTGSGKGYGIGNAIGEGDAIYRPPKPIVSSNQGGKVVLKICIDKSGVVSRIVDDRYQGTTAVEPNLFTEARNHVMKMKFSADPNAPACRVGIIPIVFKPGGQ